MKISLFLAILHLIMTFLLAVLVTFSTTRIFIRFIRRKYQITPQNVSFAVLLASVIFSVGYIISGLGEPIFKAVNIIRTTETETTAVFFGALKYTLIFILLGYIFSFAVVVLGMYLFNFINTEIDELQEISQNNIAVGILVGTIIIVVSLFVKESIVFLIENLIPYPEMPIRT
ncbi:DUF350 domain-containing protein [Raineya orbicola]|jgi:uncharacterized membrane protein YjfL (UPF0719 family)|uniref:DUF350 domain-containing protein n=1 Tax=Raineya orbicola TaxID=2016530 RepID=A0A2N3IH45_9BACT|nr:DUF350 domain-containing protein [Raineya orbicola]PKQ69639.1 hypothetical protein Rain11_1311 [Raineya orbicola]